MEKYYYKKSDFKKSDYMGRSAANQSGLMPQGPPTRQAIGVRLGSSAGINQSMNQSYFGASQKSIPGPMYGMNQSRIGASYKEEEADVPFTDRSQISAR